MNRTQLNYAVQRLTEVASRKAIAIRAEQKAECEKRLAKLPVLTAAEFLRLIKGDKIKLKSPTGLVQSSGYYRREFADISDIFDMSAYSRPNDNDDAPEYAKRIEALNNAVESTKDQLVLGDEKAALASIEKLAKQKF